MNFHDRKSQEIQRLQRLKDVDKYLQMWAQKAVVNRILKNHFLLNVFFFVQSNCSLNFRSKNENYFHSEYSSLPVLSGKTH